MAASEVKLYCEALRELVQVTTDPKSSQQLHVEALQFCDDFKAKSPLCVPCGLMLADNTEASAVRCFGFQILEHVVTFRWPVMSLEERESLKNSLMSLISAGTAAILQGEPYIRDAAARVLVEMIKRDWPLRWPMMLSELQGLSQKGALQAELVLFTLLRLAEDVVTLEKLPPGPGNLLKSALNQNMRGIFSMVENLLHHYVNEYKRLESDPAQETQAQVCCHVAAAAVNTLAGYMGWVHMSHLKEKNYRLVKILWSFLNDPKLQLEASECLLIAIDRIDIGTGICVLFADLPVQHLSPAQTADGEGLTDRCYSFLKRQCHLLCVFIKQLCLTMDAKPFVEIPSNFGTYLDILLDFTTHSSQFLSSLTQSTWRLIFEHALLSRNPSVLAMIPKYLRAVRRNLVKVGFPSKNNSPSCEYSHLEFVCDNDFCEFLTTFHDEQRTVIEAACLTDQRTWILSEVLDLIEEMKDPKAQSLKRVRRFVCSCLIQLCRNNAQNLLLHFEVLNQKVKQLLGNEKLMQMEKITLIKAMVLIINQFKNYQQQKALLEELMAPMASVWQSQEIKLAFSKPEAFIQYVGANLQITDKVMESATGRNRSRIMDCVSTILGVLTWSRWPTDLDEAKAGGFVTGFMHSGRPIYRNPCTEKVRILLKKVFSLIRNQQHLYLPNMIRKHSGPFAKALDLLEVENSSPLDLPQPLLDICDPPEYNTELERMQAFFCTLYETCFSILGHAGSSMNDDFYTMKGICDKLFQCVFPIQKRIPHYRLRSMVRVFFKPLVHCCPPEYYETLLCPIMKRFLDCCNIRLSFEWNIINQRNEANKESAAVETPESEKTRENQVKLLTGEVMELVFACCVPNEDTSVIAASSDVCCVSNEDADNTGCSTESDVASVPNEDASVIAASHGADSSVAATTSDDVCCMFNGDADNTVCAAESDDDVSVCNEDADTGSLAAVSGDCCVFIRKEAPSPVLAVEFNDGEMAAEWPLLPQPTELTMLGVCLLKAKARRASLLRTAFSSLLWNDSLTCYRIATRLCWPLLMQAISEPLAVDDMVHVFSLVLSGTQKHKDDHFSSDALVSLAFHIYESMLSSQKGFRKRIKLVHKSFYLQKFDLIAFSSKIPKRGTMSKDDLKHLIKECSNKAGNTAIRIPAPPILKRKNPPIPVQEPKRKNPPVLVQKPKRKNPPVLVQELNNRRPPPNTIFRPPMHVPLIFTEDDFFSDAECFF